MTPNVRRLLIVAAVLAPALALFGWLAWEADRVRPARVVESGIAAVGGPFRLQSTTGGTLSNEDLKGRPFALFFGFTRCPDVCPTTLAEYSALYEALRKDGVTPPRLIFVTADPERDDVDSLKRYIQSFSDAVIGLTGSQAEIAELVRAYRAYVRKVPTKDGDYTIDHTASVYLMDRNGGFVGTVAADEGREPALAKLRRLARG